MTLEKVETGANTVVGVKQTLKAIAHNKAKMVLIAMDADAHITSPVKKLCEENKVEVQEVSSMSELGKAYGIHVGAAAIAILKD